MKKNEIKNILISMRSNENSEIVNNLLGKIDLLDEESLSKAAQKAGNTEESIRHFFEKRLSEKQQYQGEKHIQINNMYQYGVTGNCIHLHMPVKLHPMLKKYGLDATLATLFTKMFDAIDRIKELKDKGFQKFQDKDSLYMISPILKPNMLKMLSEMDFRTHRYTIKDLKDKELLEQNSEAKLAAELFCKGDNYKNVGSAIIGFDRINSKEWQEKKEKKLKEFEMQGIVPQEEIENEKNR